MKRVNKIELAILFVILLPIFIISVTSKYGMDDIWVYGFSHYVKEGIKPYKDMNLVMTPFSVYLFAIPLYIKDSFLFHCICGNILNILIALSYYYIFTQFEFKSVYKIISIVACYMIFPFITKPNYNGLIAYFVLAVICIYLHIIKQKKLTVSNIIILSVLSFLAIMTKQSTGAFLTAAVCICGLYLSIIYDKKTAFKNCFIFAVSLTIQVLATCLILKSLGIFEDFINMLFHTSFMINIEAMKLVIMILTVQTISMLYMTIKLYRKTKNEAYIVIGIIQLFFGIGIYPLPNFYHYITTYFVSFIMIFIFMKEFKDELIHQLSTSVPIGAIIMISPLLCYLASSDVLSSLKTSDSETPECYHVYANLDEHADLINEYINNDKDHKYYIINEISMLSNLRNDGRYNKYYDMMWSGNIDSQNALDLIKKADCDYFIVYDDKNDTFWQYDMDAINYIYNLEKIATISCDEGAVYAVYANTSN